MKKYAVRFAVGFAVWVVLGAYMFFLGPALTFAGNGKPWQESRDAYCAEPMLWGDLILSMRPVGCFLTRPIFPRRSR